MMKKYLGKWTNEYLISRTDNHSNWPEEIILLGTQDEQN